MARTPEPPLPKEKEQGSLSRVPDHEGGRESRWARAALWRVRGGSEREHGVERVDSTVNENNSLKVMLLHHHAEEITVAFS